MTAKLDAAIKALPAVKITGDSTDADREIDEVRNRLQELRNVTVTGKFDNAKMIADIKAAEAELKALEDKKVNVQVTADTKSARSELSQLTAEADKSTNAFQKLGAAGTPMAAGISAAIIPALTSIGQLSGALGLLPSGRGGGATGFATLKIGTQGMADAFKAAEASEKANEAATKADAQAQKDTAAATTASAAAGKGNIAVLQQAVAAGAAHVAQLKAEQLAGKNVTAELKAAETAQAANVAALKTAQAASTGNTGAINNMNAAQKQANTSVSQAKAAHDAAAKAADAQAAAMNNLAPAAQGVVSAVLQLEPAFTSLRMDVQQHLFDGLKQTLLDTANTALPVVRTGLTQMADAINTAVKNVGSFIQQQSSIQAWQGIFANIGQAATNLAGAVKPILQIITDVTTVGSQFLPQLAQHFADAAQKAADFVSKAKETGQLAQWIQTGITAVKDLWDSLKNVVAIIKDLATAQGFGPNFLQALKDVTAGIRWLTDNIPGLTSLVQAFIDAWVLAKIVTGIQSVITIVGGLGTAIDGAVAKLAALTTAETAAGTAATAAGTATAAAGTAATGAAAGFSGLLLPLAALATAVYEATTHWQAFIQGFKDMGAVAVQGAREIVDGAKAIGDAFTGDFGAAKRALDDADAGFKALRTQLNDHSGFDAATTAEGKLTTAVDKATTAMDKQTNQLASAINAAVDFHTKMDALSQSIKDNGTSLDINTAAGRNNITAVTDMITAAQNFETQAQQQGQSTQELATLHDNLSNSIKGATAQMPLQGTALGTLVQDFVNAGPKMSLKPTVDPANVIAGVKTVQDTINSIKNPPPVPFTGNADDIKAKSAEAKTAAAPPPSPAPTKFTGDASDVKAKSAEATTAAKAPPVQHNTTFIGIIDDIQQKIPSVTSAIGGVVQKWLTSFFGDTTNLSAGATQANNLIDTVKSTHGSSFTGDASGLSAAVATANAGIASVKPAPPVVKFTADITDVTAKTQTATTQIAAVAATHATTLTGDLTGANGVTQAASTATTQINAIPTTHNTVLTVDASAALAAVQQFTAAINSIPTSHVTVLSTIRAGAGGMIVTKMATGGIVPMAQGGYTPMSASEPAIVPPNTMRLIGDRPIGDEAFIPINTSGASTALLSETASRMGYSIAPMHRGGRSWDDDDDDGDEFWDWWRRHHHHGGGGGQPPPPVVPPTPFATNPGGIGSLTRNYNTALAAGGGKPYQIHPDYNFAALQKALYGTAGGVGGRGGGHNYGGGGFDVRSLEEAVTRALSAVFSSGVRMDADYNALTLRVNQVNRSNSRR